MNTKRILIPLSVFALICASACTEEHTKKTAVNVTAIQENISDSELEIGWTQDDRISLLTAEDGAVDFNFSQTTNGVSSFSADLSTKRAQILCGFYPADYSPEYSESSISFTLPETLSAYQDRLKPMPAVTYGGNEPVLFKNIFGVLSLSFTGTAYLEQIRISAEEQSLSGKVTVDMSDPDTLSTEVSGSNSLGYKIGASLSEENTSTFYCIMPSGNYPKLTVAMSDGNGQESEYVIENITVTTNCVTAVEDLIPFYRFEEETQLDDKGRANCYMVYRPGTYYFDCTKSGNSSESIGKVDKVEMLWNDYPGLFTNIRKEGSDIYFDVTDVIPGNCLIAAMDKEGNILWSWHIWCTGNELPKINTYTNFQGATFEIMDRTLGSLYQDSFETLYYQWGRKDPFSNMVLYDIDGKKLEWSTDVESKPSTYYYGPVKGEKYGTIENSIRYPMTFITYTVNGRYKYDWLLNGDNGLWGDSKGTENDGSEYIWTESKTKYDPCPPGYRVANGYTWTNFTNTGENEETTTNFNVIGEHNNGWRFKMDKNDSQGDFYVASGVRYNSDGRLGPVGLLGVCWSSCPGIVEGYKAICLNHYPGGVYPQYDENRAFGFSVRCVKEQ